MSKEEFLKLDFVSNLCVYYRDRMNIKDLKSLIIGESKRTSQSEEEEHQIQ